MPLADHLTLGRAEDNDVVVDDERMSRHHSEIVCHADGRVEVKDLGSRTGTKVNGEAVKSRLLKNGDEIVFGPLHARIEMDAPAKPEPEEKPKAELTDATSSTEKQRLSEEIETLRRELADWRNRASQERAEHETKLRMLRSAEERLGPIQAAATHAETAHSGWLAAIEALSVEHKETTALLTKAGEELESKQTALEKIKSETEAARGELTALTEQQKSLLEKVGKAEQTQSEAAATVERLRQEAAELEAKVGEQRRLSEELESRIAKSQPLADEKAAQVAVVEAKVKELLEEQSQLQPEVDRMKTELAELETRLSDTQQQHEGTQKLLQEAGAALQKLQNDLAGHEKRVREAEALKETREAEARAAEEALKQLQQQQAAAEAKLGALQELTAEEQQVRQSLGELSGREAALKAEISSLSAAVREKQATLDEIRILGAQQEETARAIEQARSEIASLTARLTPLREWKDAMDLLYARFADLPQASPEAQEVWREIESGKAKLRQYIISTQRRSPRIAHIEFSKEGLKPRLPMKSERMRGKADGKKA